MRVFCVPNRRFWDSRRRASWELGLEADLGDKRGHLVGAGAIALARRTMR